MAKTISLYTSAEITNMEYRYEIKYLRNAGLGTTTLLENLKRHPAVFTERYLPRRVNNIYFDSINFDAAEENVSGYANRRKVRARWYGNSFGTNTITLEFKNKKGVVGSKNRYPLGEVRLAIGDQLAEVFAKSFSQLPKHAGELMADIRPSLMNSYFRRYYQSRCGKFRATLDTNICYFAVAKGIFPSLPSATLEDTQILEIKYAVEDQRFINFITQHFPFRVTKSSKYVNGIDILSCHGLC